MYKKTLQISFILIICMIVGIMACITDGISETFSAVSAINYSRSDISEIFETESGKALLSSFQSSEAYMPDALEEISLETPVWAFITFEGESLSERYLRQSRYGTFSEYVISSEADEYESLMIAQQLGLIDELEKQNIDIYVKYSYTTLDNSLGVLLRYGDIGKVRETEGVSDVFLAPSYSVPEAVADGTTEEKNFESDYIESTGILKNSTQYTGEGMVIAIVDTGLDYRHSAFATEPDNQAFQLSDIERLMSRLSPDYQASELYISGKIPYAYDYADDDNDVCPSDTAVNNLGNGHGTHVAGIVAGNDDVIRGVVPDAQLCIFKVFSDSSGGASTIDIVAALADVAVLNVDVVNLSLGSYAGYSTEYEQGFQYVIEMYRKINSLGISACISSGNDGFATSGSANMVATIETPDYGLTGSPASYKENIAVASVDNSTMSYIMSGDSKIYFFESVNENSEYRDFVRDMLKDNENSEFEIVCIGGYGRDEDYDGIDAEGKVVLVSRGDNSFEDKQRIAAEHGAIACIVYNSGPARINMQIISQVIPCCSVTYDDGMKLMNSDGKIKISKSYKQILLMSSFSSWGCTPDMVLKPDITAPGGEIYSSMPSSYGKNYEYYSGTSMAAPNVSGATAAIRQYLKETNPGMSKLEIYDLAAKLIMSTAIQCVDINGNLASVRHQGAGLINIAGAVSTQAYIDVVGQTKPVIELGEDTQKVGKYTLSFNVVNFSDSDITYNIDLTVLCDEVSGSSNLLTMHSNKLEASENIYSIYIDGEISDGEVKVPAGGKVKVKVVFGLTENDREYLEKFEYGTFVEGYLNLKSADTEKTDLTLTWFSFFGEWAEAPVFDYTIYDEEDPAIYETAVVVALSDNMLFALGAYTYILPEGHEEIAADPEKNAISFNPGAYTQIYSVYMGLLRNVTGITYTITDALTGAEIWSTEMGSVRKTLYKNGTITPAAHSLQLYPADLGLYNNQELLLTVKASFIGDEDDINSRNVYEFPFVVDSEAPSQYDAEFYVEDGRTYMSLCIYDNQYLSNIQLYSKKGNQTVAVYDYAIPAEDLDWESGKPVIIDLTDYLENITDGKLIVYAEDYARNYSAIEYTLYTDDDDIDAGVSDTEKTYTDTLPYTVGEGIYEAGLVIDGTDVYYAGTAELHMTSFAEYDRSELKEYSSPEDFVIENGVLTAYKGYAKHVIIPDGVIRIADGILEDSAGSSVFGAHTEIETVTVPETMKYFGLASFAYCTNLRECNIPEGTLALYEGVFYGCTSLKSITIPSTVTTYGRGIFYKCESLKDVVILSNTDMTNDYMFGMCTSLERIEIPEGITEIGAYYFYGDQKLSEVVLPSTLKTIRNYAFYFTGFTYLDLSQSVIETIETRGFAGNKLLTELLLPSTLKEMGEAAFSTCTTLEKVNLEDTALSELKSSVFAFNYKLKEVIFPDGVTIVGNTAFSTCTSLEKVTFSSMLREIDSYCFKDCYNLSEINLEDTRVSKIYPFAFEKCVGLKNIILPRFMTDNIGSSAFIDTSVENITLLSSYVSVLGSDAFGKTDENGNINHTDSFVIYVKENVYEEILSAWGQYAKYIKSLSDYDLSTSTYTLNSYTGSEKDIIIPSAVKIIGSGAFKDNTTIESVFIPQGTVEIGDSAFENTSSLISVDIPASCESIGSGAFRNSSVQDVTVRNPMPPQLGEGAFDGTGAGLILRIPEESRDLYGEAQGWKELSEYFDEIQMFVITNGVLTKYIGDGGRVVIPDDVVSIGYRAFYGITSVTEVVFGKGLESIGQEAFYNCTSLSDISFKGEKLKTIGNAAFEQCISLKEADLPEGLVSLGSYCFKGCSSLMSFTIPSTLGYIPDHGFYFCTALTDIYIPDNIKSIGNYAFAECTGVERVVIDANISRISQAFIAMDGLRELIINGNIGYIGTVDGLVSVDFSTTSLERVIINGSVEMFGSAVFCCNPNLTEVYFNGDIGNIAENAFSANNALQTVYFGGDLEGIWDGAFNNCFSLEKYSVSEDNPYLTVDEYGVMYDKEMTRIFKQPFAWDYDGEYIMPDSVEEIDQYGFGYQQNNVTYAYADGIITTVGGTFDVLHYRTKLTGVVISSGLSEIPENCFLRFSSLERVIFREGSKASAIGRQAFYECSALTEIDFADSIEKIDEYAFAYCTSLKEVELPENMKNLGKSAFGYCTSLETVRVHNNIENFNTETSFNECPNLVNIVADEDNPYFTVIDGVMFSKDMKTLISYPSSKQDKEYIIPEGILKIGKNAFNGNEYIERVILPSSLKVIGDKAFYSTPSLKQYVFMSMEAPVLECSYDAEYNLNYCNFGGRIGETEGIKMYYLSGAEGFDTYIWQLYFGK